MPLLLFVPTVPVGERAPSFVNRQSSNVQFSAGAAALMNGLMTVPAKVQFLYLI
jgi:hypothetical protein